MRTTFPARALLICLVLFGVALAAQDAPAHGKAAAAAGPKFSNFPGLPKCFTAAVEDGDPTKGSAVILAKATAGCTVPWHWHTSSERLMGVSGNAVIEMKDGSPAKLGQGGFVNLPAKHQHQAHCTTACTFFIVTDAAFDIHYVDASGNEIPADQALKQGAGAMKKAAGAAKKKS